MSPELSDAEWEQVRWMLHDAIIYNGDRHRVLSLVSTVQAFIGRPRSERP